MDLNCLVPCGHFNGTRVTVEKRVMKGSNLKTNEKCHQIHTSCNCKKFPFIYEIHIENIRRTMIGVLKYFHCKEKTSVKKDFDKAVKKKFSLFKIFFKNNSNYLKNHSHSMFGEVHQRKVRSIYGAENIHEKIYFSEHRNISSKKSDFFHRRLSTYGDYNIDNKDLIANYEKSYETNLQKIQSKTFDSKREVILRGIGCNELIDVHAKRHVEVLEVGGCYKGKTLPASLLQGMRNLRTLSLWGNEITTFPNRFFLPVLNIKELFIWGNNISDLRNVIFGMARGRFKSLKLVDLDYNSISYLNFDHKKRKRNKQLKKRKKRRRRFNQDKLSSLFGQNVEVLKLGHNKIRSIPKDCFKNLQKLKHLALHSNKLEYVYPGAFDGLQRLVMLDLADNQIQYFSDRVFSSLKNLKELKLRKNRLKMLWHETFRGLSMLNRIDLSYNQIHILNEGIFKNSPNLVNINLESNFIEKLPNCFNTTEVAHANLKFLNLNNNPVNCTCGLLTFMLDQQQAQLDRLRVSDDNDDTDIFILKKKRNIRPIENSVNNKREIFYDRLLSYSFSHSQQIKFYEKNGYFEKNNIKEARVNKNNFLINNYKSASNKTSQPALIIKRRKGRIAWALNDFNPNKSYRVTSEGKEENYVNNTGFSGKKININYENISYFADVDKNFFSSSFSSENFEAQQTPSIDKSNYPNLRQKQYLTIWGLCYYTTLAKKKKYQIKRNFEHYKEKVIPSKLTVPPNETFPFIKPYDSISRSKENLRKKFKSLRNKRYNEINKNLQTFSHSFFHQGSHHHPLLPPSFISPSQLLLHLQCITSFCVSFA